tara:strand:- start:3057 stop:3902 length:846 start_codon:yes stop_codon:yes gene_type:complete
MAGEEKVNDYTEFDGVDLMNIAIEKYNPSHIFGLFSGGTDSLTACHVASQHPKFSGCAHINTGIGVPQTRDFVYETCKEQGWLLKEYKAEDEGQVYEDIIREHGFPGPFAHRMMYTRLKERALRSLIREHKQFYRDKIMLISGCRSDESRRRMGTVKPIDPQGAQLWVAIIHNWSKPKCLEYLGQHGVETNPVAKLIGKSGECLCGAFAKKGELDELHEHFPEVAERIMDLEQEVRAKFPWDWEAPGPPKWWKQQQEGQECMFDMTQPPGPMCWGCHKGKR